MVSIVSRVPSRRVKAVGDNADTGSVVSLVFLSVGATSRNALTASHIYSPTGHWSEDPQQVHRVLGRKAKYLSPHRVHVQSWGCGVHARLQG